MATLRMKAIFDCKADRHGELSFKEGDVLVDIVESSEGGWFEGRLENISERGLFPFNYVENLSCTSNIQPHCFVKENQDTEKSRQFDNVGDQYKVDRQKGNVSSQRSFFSSKESMIIKRSNDSAPNVSLLRASLRKVEEKSKPGTRIISPNVLEMLKENKAIGVKQDISSIAQSHDTPSLPNTRHANIDCKVRTTNSILQKRGQEVISDDGPQQLIGIHHVKLVASTDNQLLKPSQLKNTLIHINTSGGSLVESPKTPSPLSPRVTGTTGNQSVLLPDTCKRPSRINVTENSFRGKCATPTLKNPAPSLPSRPRSIASRKLYINRNSDGGNNIKSTLEPNPVVATASPNSRNKQVEDEKKGQINSLINKSAAPVIKPKPNGLRPALPPRSNSSQTSGMVQLERQTSLHPSKSDDALVTQKTCPSPPAQPKESFISAKPPPPPKPAKSSRTKINCQSPANEKNEHTNPAPVGSKLSTNKEIKIEVPEKNAFSLPNKLDNKKVPPPPPPSRSPRVHKNEPVAAGMAARTRYAILFETIQDKGYVDEDVAQAIWRKYKLSKQDIGFIWKECGSDNTRQLDKNAFINSMRMIDTMVSRQKHAV